MHHRTEIPAYLPMKIRNTVCECSFSKIHCFCFDLIVTYPDSQREKFVILRKLSQCFANRIRKKIKGTSGLKNTVGEDSNKIGSWYKNI